ncbi:hypothetical protein BDN70DRAFT_309222 [Pholiota conissans]|uniref:Uncharacterized protein n=1 Tax=Pholiota conissans TaxID=109636 RepID=A0A9P6CVU8_9AGAR|nr:hypothetical protein BDN70DRAFT_309222 [Pholiota conissans]
MLRPSRGKARRKEKQKENNNTRKTVCKEFFFSFLSFLIGVGGKQQNVNIIALENWSEEQNLTVRTVRYTTVPIQANGGAGGGCGCGGMWGEMEWNGWGYGRRGSGDCENKCEVRNAASLRVYVSVSAILLLLPAAAFFNHHLSC